MASAPGFQELLAGNYFSAVSAPYQALMGDFFWAFVILMAMMAIYLKTEDYTVTGIVGILISTSISTLLPIETYWIGYMSIVLAITVVFHKFLTR